LRIRFRPVTNAQDAANDVPVDFDAESQCDLLSDSGTTPTGVPPFHCHDGIDQFFHRSLRPGSAPALLRKQHTILSFPQQVVKMQESRRLQNDGRAQQAYSTYESRAQTSDHPIRRAEIGRTLAATIHNEQLMPEQDGFTNHGTKPARPCQPDHQHNQMNQKDQKDQEVTYPGIVSRP